MHIARVCSSSVIFFDAYSPKLFFAPDSLIVSQELLPRRQESLWKPSSSTALKTSKLYANSLAVNSKHPPSELPYGVKEGSVLTRGNVCGKWALDTEKEKEIKEKMAAKIDSAFN